MVCTRAINQLFRRSATLSVGPVVLPCRSSLASNFLQSQHYSSEKAIRKSSEGNKVQTGFAEVAKENTKSAWYMSIIVAGVGVTAWMFYAIFNELFSGKSPNSVYAKAVERCTDDSRLKDALGEPLKAYGEETRRGRRTHVSHSLWEHNGVKHMRMKFYMKGIRNRATVHLEVQENESGKFDYRYLFAQLEDFSRKVIVLEDNRAISETGLNNFGNEPVLALS